MSWFNKSTGTCRSGQGQLDTGGHFFSEVLADMGLRCVSVLLLVVLLHGAAAFLVGPASRPSHPESFRSRGKWLECSPESAGSGKNRCGHGSDRKLRGIMPRMQEQGSQGGQVSALIFVLFAPIDSLSSPFSVSPPDRFLFPGHTCVLPDFSAPGSTDCFFNLCLQACLLRVRLCLSPYLPPLPRIHQCEHMRGNLNLVLLYLCSSCIKASEVHVTVHFSPRFVG